MNWALYERHSTQNTVRTTCKPVLISLLKGRPSTRLKEEWYPLETRTDDKWFFSLMIVDGLVIRCLAGSYRHLTIPRFIDCGWCESKARYWSGRMSRFSVYTSKRHVIIQPHRMMKITALIAVETSRSTSHLKVTPSWPKWISVHLLHTPRWTISTILITTKLPLPYFLI